jgi:SAM-dependent methyltransferase
MMHAFAALRYITRQGAARLADALGGSRWVRPHPFRPDRTTLQVNVRELIERLDLATLRSSADGYFASIGIESPQCSKPFMDVDNAVHLCTHLGLLFESAALFRGCRVLDYGCGTGWLSLAMAQMGCDAIGVDVSANAVRLAEQVVARDPVKKSGTANFQVYDGERLPFDDASFDRIVCFDAFHHARDQLATLREFHRVLKVGGRVAFVEPGPQHSTTAQSQAEMVNHQVIENDVVMEEIVAHANEIGFEPPELLLQFQRPVTVTAKQFLRWSQQGMGRAEAHKMVFGLLSSMTDGQYFFLQKGHGEQDSRRSDGLAGRLRMLDYQWQAVGDGGRLQFTIEASNTGHSTWLCDRRSAGQVNLAAQLTDRSGRIVDNNLARFALPAMCVRPGESAIVSGSASLANPHQHCLRFDLVAEMVTWFSQIDPATSFDWRPPNE